MRRKMPNRVFKIYILARSVLYCAPAFWLLLRVLALLKIRSLVTTIDGLYHLFILLAIVFAAVAGHIALSSTWRRTGRLLWGIVLADGIWLWMVAYFLYTVL